MTVTPANIAVALGRDTPDAPIYEQWEMWIDDAIMLIEARAEALEVTDPLDAAKLDYVVREAVVAQVRRPDDATQVTVSVTDASTSRSYQRSGGRVTIRDEWWTLLGLTSATTGISSYDTAYGAGVHAAWCTLNFGGLYCSCGADLTNYAYSLFGGDDGEYW